MIWDFLGGMIKPVTDLVSEFVEDKDKANQIRAEMFKIQTDVSVKMMDYEKQLLEAQSSIIVAEAQGGSWLQRSWRPITMLVFLALVVADSFGWLANPLADEAWTLLQIGLGGYVTGRSLEKLAPKVTEVMKR
jgi:hypothetical protein